MLAGATKASATTTVVILLVQAITTSTTMARAATATVARTPISAAIEASSKVAKSITKGAIVSTCLSPSPS